MHYPRIIIIGETFRLNEGGGITLANLFKEWPAGNVGVVTDLISHTDRSSKYSYYQLGYEEIKFPFPFYLFQTYFKSGPFRFDNPDAGNDLAGRAPGLTARLKKKIRPWFDNVLNRAGLFSFFYKVKLSDSLKKWITAFRPDIIYLQPFYHHMMCFGNLLYDEMKIPYAIHIMDDSVSYVNRRISGRKSFQRQVDNDFRRLVGNAAVRMCISEAMADEYFNRYGHRFMHFRNPIEAGRWLHFRKDGSRPDTGKLKIIYTGRTYPPYFHSVLDVCRAVDSLNRQNMDITLCLSPHNVNPAFRKKIKNLKGISFYKSVSGDKIPELVSGYDVFLICADFDENSRRYLNLSISTRASEGMISGVPVLIYAPGQSALARYFMKNDAGFVVGEQDMTKLEEAITIIGYNNDYRQRVSGNAVMTALNDSDSVVVRDGFRKALSLNTRENG